MKRTYGLGFISDEDIFNHVRQTVELYRTTINNAKAKMLDPINLMFVSNVYGKSVDSVIKEECLRQIDEMENNYIGLFHKNIFRHAKNGWEVCDNKECGFDVLNTRLHIYAIMNNKRKPLNQRGVNSTIIAMNDMLLRDKQAVCMLVEYNTDKSNDEVWDISSVVEAGLYEQRRLVSIDKFYEKVFEDESAFKKLCNVLPLIIGDVMETFQTKGAFCYG